VWRSFYSLSDDNKAKILAFLVYAKENIAWRLPSLPGVLERIEKFVVSDAKTEPIIAGLHEDIPTAYIHGDLNGSNILIQRERPVVTVWTSP
jgi:hypothetical protein